MSLRRPNRYEWLVPEVPRQALTVVGLADPQDAPWCELTSRIDSDARPSSP